MNLFQKLDKKELIELFENLESSFLKFNIDFYIIGGLARDLIITGKYDITIPRATLDVDIALMIPNYEIFNKLKKNLILNDFKEDKTKGYRFYFKNTIIIDFLPFGGIENSEHTVKIYGKEIHSLNVLGLNELKEYNEILEYDENKSFKVTSIPVICILKLISWNDKPYEREKDIDDFTFILSKYSDIYLEEICNNHYDLLKGGWNNDILSPRVLGREIGVILKNTEKSKVVVLDILKQNTKETDSSKLGILMSRFNKKSIEENCNILIELLKGIEERLQKDENS